MNTQYITTQEALSEICQQYQQADILAVDTEFVRTRTLFPKLGLLQVFDGKTIALIDTVVLDDLSDFWALLTNDKIKKVLHACSEDLEVFLTKGNCRPVNLIDSQVMMSFLGHGLSLGYAAMVQHYLSIELDKSESRTDWTKRPLSDKQLNYAQADVTHLFELYPQLEKDLIAAGWEQAAQQDTEQLINKKFSPIDVNNLYKQVKMSWKLTPKQLNNLKYLAAWRYDQAVKKDLPLGFVVKEPTLIAVAQFAPKSTAEMASLPGIDGQDVRYRGKAMLMVLKQASQVDASEYPKKIQRLDEYPGYKQTFKKVKQFIVSCAEQHQQTIENFASKKQINQFLSWHYQLNPTTQAELSVDICSNWRYQLFGEQLIEHAKSQFSGL